MGGQIQEEVSEIISRRIKDPRLGFVTVTGVKVTADLKYASVYVSVMGSDQDIETSFACLRGAARFVRTELGKRLRIKRIPEIRFRYDDTGIKGARIDSLLRGLRKNGDGADLPGDC